MSIDATKWTSDWYIGREIFAAYEDSRHKDLCILCIGDPETPAGFLVEPVGQQLAKYHPNVFGTLTEPVHPGNLADKLAEHGAFWRSRFLLIIAPKGGLAEEIGLIVPSRSPWIPPDESRVPPLGNMVLYATVFFDGMEDAGVPANPHLERRAHQAAHVIVDGVLRFFHKIEYDHTAFEQARQDGLWAD